MPEQLSTNKKSSTRTLKCVVLECSTLKFGFCFSFYVPSSNDDFKLLRNLLVLTLLCRELYDILIERLVSEA